MKYVYYRGYRWKVTREFSSGYLDLESVGVTEKMIVETELSVHESDVVPYYEKRMYFFVNRSLSEIQKGIQAGHAAIEYARHYGTTEEFQNFAKYDKTFILLNGGNSNSHDQSKYGLEPFFGTMEELGMELSKLCDSPYYYNSARFFEPDLNYSLTALAFIVDERAYDTEKYPVFIKWLDQQGTPAKDLVEFAMLPDDSPLPWELRPKFDAWMNTVMGGMLNVHLRNLITGKKLA